MKGFEGRTMAADLIQTIIELRNGAVARQLSDKFNDLIAGVIEAGGKGEMTVKFSVRPQEKGPGGTVVTVEISHDIKVKKPEIGIGPSTFFIKEDGSLTREDPAQDSLFAETKETKNA